MSLFAGIDGAMRALAGAQTSDKYKFLTFEETGTAGDSIKRDRLIETGFRPSLVFMGAAGRYVDFYIITPHVVVSFRPDGAGGISMSIPNVKESMRDGGFLCPSEFSLKNNSYYAVAIG